MQQKIDRVDFDEQKGYSLKMFIAFKSFVQMNENIDFDKQKYYSVK